VSTNDINSPLQLIEVFNELGENITELNYFTLIQLNSNENGFQLQATAAYYDAIYFGEEESISPQGLRNFSLTFVAEVNNQPLNVTRELTLANVPPTINLPLDGTTFNITNNTENITTIDCVNGADNVNLASIFSIGSCVITSQTNSQGEDVTYFNILDTPTIVGGEAKFQLVNTQVGNVPVDRYELTICVQDAGGQNDQDCIDIVIDFGAKVQGVKQFSYSRKFRRKDRPSGPATGGFDTWYQTITVFEVYGGASSQAWGWYLYPGPWSNESSLESLTTLNFSTEFGVDNPPNRFISQFPTGYGGYAPIQTMFGPIQPPLTSSLGANGFINIDFTSVNQSPLYESIRFSNVSEQAVIDLWLADTDTYAYFAILLPSPEPPQIGNYAITDTGDNAAPTLNGFGWRLYGGFYELPTPVPSGTFDIDENNYDVDNIDWQVNV
jgi:hypothetical protein